MKKVLILAYDFPPFISVAALRPKAWYDYFHEFDIEPIIVTRQWQSIHLNEFDYLEKGTSENDIIESSKYGTIIQSPFNPNLSNRLLLKYGHSKYRLIRKMITAWYEVLQFPVPVGTKSGLYFSAKKYLSKNRVDCIIATGEPFVLFQYAHKLSTKFDTPWVADYRDVWTSFYENTNRPIEKQLNRFYQKKSMKSVSFISTVSDLVKNKIKQHVPNNDFLILPNGYDPDAIAEANKTPQAADKLRIAIIGTIQPWNPFETFLEELNNILTKHGNLNIELCLIGVNQSDYWKKLINEKYKTLNLNTSFQPKMENSKLLKTLSTCNVLLLFNYYSFMGTKIYDYLALKRQILFCFSDDEISKKLKKKHFFVHEMKNEKDNLQEDLISSVNGGIIVKNHNELEKHILDLSAEHATQGYITSNSKNIEQYSRRSLSQKLANEIHSRF